MKLSALISRTIANRQRLLKWRIAIIVLAVIASAALFNLANASGLPVIPLEIRIQSWINELANPKMTVERHNAQQHLEEAGDASVDPLLQALKSDNVVLRRNSADMLTYINSPRAGEMLLKAMNNDPDATVRVNAAWALGELKSAVYIKDLESTSVLDPNPDVRVAAIESLQHMVFNFANTANLDETEVGAFAIAPSDSNSVYLTSRRDLFVSGDGGKTWQILHDVLPSQVLTLEIDPNNPSVLFAGVDGLGLYKSPDGGLTWQAINTGLDVKPGARVGITAIAIDETNSQRVLVAEGLWIGTNTVQFIPLGIFQSLDGGATWQLQVKATNTRAINRMILKGDELYAIAGDNNVLMMAID